MRFQKKISDRIIGGVITIIFLFIIFSGSPDFTHTVEMKRYDLKAKFAASEEVSPDIEPVVVTESDINELAR